MAQTAIADALERAGWSDPLDKIALEAWRKWSGENGRGARRDHVRTNLTPALTLALLERYRPQVVRQMVAESIAALLNDAETEIRDAAKAAGGGRDVVDAQGDAAPAKPPGDKPADDRGHSAAETQGLSAPVVTPFRDAGASRRGGEARSGAEPTHCAPSADKHAATIAAKLGVAARLSKLDTESINGQPVKLIRVGEARAWAAKHKLRARWIELLTANMPDEWVIGDHVPPDLADELYQRAEAEHAA